VRWGGEEFLLWLPDTGTHEAVRVADKRRAGVCTSPLEMPDGQALPVTVSVGLATWRQGEPVEAALARADAALYAAKHAGRNRVRLAELDAQDLSRPADLA
jgi:diguanylate cyclase